MSQKARTLDLHFSRSWFAQRAKRAHTWLIHRLRTAPSIHRLPTATRILVSSLHPAPHTISPHRTVPGAAPTTIIRFRHANAVLVTFQRGALVLVQSAPI